MKYFQEYLSTGTDTQQKDCYVYMNMIYQSQKNYSEQERVLEEAIAKYPVSLDFLYNLVNVHIATNNMPKLLSAIDRILEVDPNNDKVLPIKARILERQERIRKRSISTSVCMLSIPIVLSCLPDWRVLISM